VEMGSDKNGFYHKAAKNNEAMYDVIMVVVAKLINSLMIPND
jgi:hypothetical protein